MTSPPPPPPPPPARFARRNAEDGYDSLAPTPKLPPLVNCMAVLRLRLRHLSHDDRGGGEEDMELV